MESEPLFCPEDRGCPRCGDDAEMARRAARAVRNLIKQVGDQRLHWGRWVPEWLDQLADRMESSDG